MEKIDSFMVYYNTRVRAMKSLLLTREQLDEILAFGDIDRMIEFLLNSPYEAEMAEALTRYQGADAVEDAVSRNLVRTFQRLIKFAQGDFRDLAEIFLQRWDLAAVKAILRTKHHNLDPERALEDVPPGPTLTVPLINEIVAADNMTEVVARLVGWNPELAQPLQQHLAEYQETRRLEILEEAIDRRYFSDTAKRLRGRDDEDSRFLLRLIQMEIDRINLRILYRARHEEDSEKVLDRVLPFGSLSAEVLKRLAEAEAPEDLVAPLGATAYREMSQTLAAYIHTGRFSALERFFERIVIGEIRRLARQNLFSIAVLMLYAWLKYNEALNLRLIARGIARDLPQGRVREEIIYA